MAFGGVQSGTGPDKCTCWRSKRILPNLSKQACRSHRFGHFSSEVARDLEALQQSLSALHPLKFELSEVCRKFLERGHLDKVLGGLQSQSVKVRC